MQDDIKERNRKSKEGVFKATNDPKRPLVPPAVEAVPPHLISRQWRMLWTAGSIMALDYRKALEQANASGGAALASASLPKSIKCSSKASAD